MTFVNVIIFIVLAGVLFGILNVYTKKKSDSLTYFDVNKIVISSLFIVLISGFNPKLDTSFLWLIVLFEFIYRLGYIYLFLDKGSIITGKYYLLNGINIFTAFLVNLLFINRVNSVFLSGEEIRVIFWLGLVFYLFYNFKGEVSSLLLKLDNKSDLNNEEYVVMMYAKFKNKYQDIVTESDKINNLVYAMMIMENELTPKFIRKVKTFWHRTLGTDYYPKGIMQVSSVDNLDDEASIKLVVSEVKKLMKKSDVVEVVNNYYTNEEKRKIVIKYYEIIEAFIK